MPSSTSIQPVDARSSSFLFETDDHWFAHNLRHSTSQPSFLRHRRSFSSSMRRTLYYHQHESTDLLDMYSDGARTLRITYFGETRSPRGVSSRGTYYWGTYLSSCCSLLPMLLPSCHFYIFFMFLHFIFLVAISSPFLSSFHLAHVCPHIFRNGCIMSYPFVKACCLSQRTADFTSLLPTTNYPSHPCRAVYSSFAAARVGLPMQLVILGSCT